MHTRNSRANEMSGMREALIRMMTWKLGSPRASDLDKKVARITLQALRPKRCICCGGAAHETEMH